MTGALLLAFAGFVFVASITPGPNNTAVVASSANHGFLRTVPHMIGITFGCIVMLALVGLGLDRVFAAVPALYSVLKVAGAGYLLWLAWKIARAGAPRAGRTAPRPMTLLQAAGFQWVNPKAWLMVIGALATYAPREQFLVNVTVIAVVMAIVMSGSIVVWAGFGVALRRVLDRPARVRAFNFGMAALLVVSLYPLLRE